MKKRGRKGKGLITDLAKTAAKSVATKGIELGAYYLKDNVSGMGYKSIASHRRIAGRKATAMRKKSHGGTGGALYPAGYQGTAIFPA